MTLLEAIYDRHAVSKFKDQPIAEDIVKVLQAKVDEVNAEGKLHIQLILNEPKAYGGFMGRLTTKGVSDYFVLAGKKADDLEERLGYYGELLVLLAQTLGLNSHWTGNSYSKIKGTYSLEEDEKIGCYVALGYGEEHGVPHKCKKITEVSNAGENTPEWFTEGVKAALQAPTAMNQQKFYFEYVENGEGKPKVVAKALRSLMGFTQLDLGIAKSHFEIGAGKENFEWA